MWAVTKIVCWLIGCFFVANPAIILYLLLSLSLFFSVFPFPLPSFSSLSLKMSTTIGQH